MEERKPESVYTYADLLEWDEETRYELYDGDPVALASPTPDHQRVVRQMLVQIEAFISGSGCRGEAFPAPLDVRLFEEDGDRPEDTTTVVQPDLLVVCDKDKLDRHGVHGAPDFVLEVTSPSTHRNDLYVKFSLYRRAGVREYWIVDPEAKAVQTFTLEDGRYMAQVFTRTDQAPVRIFPGLTIDLTAVFPPEETAEEAPEEAPEE